MSDSTQRSRTKWSSIPVLGSVRKITSNGPEAQSHVRSEVNRGFRYKKASPTGYSTQCPFHVSDDGFSMTLNINVVPHVDNHGNNISVGQFRCWSCGKKGGWNMLAMHVGLEPLEETDNADLKDCAQVVTYDREYEPAHEAMLRPLDPDWKWKRKHGKVFGPALLARYGAMLHDVVRKHGSEMWSEQRLWLPCYEDGELVGHVDAALDKDSKPKYLNANGAWAKTKFFGFDQCMKRVKKLQAKGWPRFACIVEGPGDTLNMEKYGIPALGVLGTQNWSAAKANILVTCVDVVFVIGDPDEAGAEFNTEVHDDLVGIGIDAVIIRLKGKKDPGDFKRVDADALKAELRKHLKKRA